MSILIAVEMNTPCMSILLMLVVVEEIPSSRPNFSDTPCTTIDVHNAGGRRGDTLHVDIAGCGNGYTLHVHTAGVGGGRTDIPSAHPNFR